jgi:hypothetical protein
MKGSHPDIPELWDDQDEKRLKCVHSIVDITVEIKGISGDGMKVKEGEKFSRGGNTRWDVVVTLGQNKSKHGERKSTKSEAEKLAVEFMNRFNQEYEGDAHVAYIEALEGR